MKSYLAFWPESRTHQLNAVCMLQDVSGKTWSNHSLSIFSVLDLQTPQNLPRETSHAGAQKRVLQSGHTKWKLVFECKKTSRGVTGFVGHQCCDIIWLAKDRLKQCWQSSSKHICLDGMLQNEQSTPWLIAFGLPMKVCWHTLQSKLKASLQLRMTLRGWRLFVADQSAARGWLANECAKQN